MLFDKKVYYDIINRLKFQNFLKIIISMILFTFIFFMIAYIIKSSSIILISILWMLVGLFLRILLVPNNELQILEIEMKLDIYNKIMNLK